MSLASALRDKQIVWQRILTLIRERRPLILSWFEHAVPLALHDSVLKIGFDPDRSIAIENLRRPNNLKLLSELAREVIGERTEIQLVALESQQR
jgi:hypothetical protein